MDSTTALNFLKENGSWLGPLATAICGGTIGTFFGPFLLWNIEKKRETRAHRRREIEEWHAMVQNVVKELARMDRMGENPNTGDALRLLETSPGYSSFSTTYDFYSRSGLRGLRLRIIQRPWLRQLIMPWWKPKPSAGPEHTFMVGTYLPARIHLTTKQIGEIERWWKLHR